MFPCTFGKLDPTSDQFYPLMLLTSRRISAVMIEEYILTAELCAVLEELKEEQCLKIKDPFCYWHHCPC